MQSLMNFLNFFRGWIDGEEGGVVLGLVFLILGIILLFAVNVILGIILIIVGIVLFFVPGAP